MHVCALLGQADAILVQNAAGLGFMLRAAEGRTQYQPSTRSILHQGLRPVRQHTKVGFRVRNKEGALDLGANRTQHKP